MWLHYTYPKAYKKRSFSRWFLLIFCFIAAVCGGYVYIALSRDVPAGTLEIFQVTNSQRRADAITWPARGHAAIGTLDAGVLAKSYDEEVPQPIASLAKVITALAILEQAPMQPGDTGITITLDAADEVSYWEYVNKQGTVTAVAAGEQINQYQALQAMLLPSSNNMSDSLVRRVFGSMEDYKTYANEMVTRYGLKNTHIDDASGFSPRTVSTPSEMIVIGQKALEHPVIAEIVAQKEAELPIAGMVPNYNGFLNSENATGIKPGNTDEAGWCLLFSAAYPDDSGQDTTFIGVVLRQDDPFTLLNESERILQEARSSIERVEVVHGGEAVGTYTSQWGEKAELIAQESLWALTMPGSVPVPAFQQAGIAHPLSENEIVGTLQLGPGLQQQTRVIAATAVGDPPLTWRLLSPLRSLGLIQ